jgi:hypothetical protein
MSILVNKQSSCLCLGQTWQSVALGFLANKACALTSDDKGKDELTRGVLGIISKSFVWSTVRAQAFVSNFTFELSCKQSLHPNKW